MRKKNTLTETFKNIRRKLVGKVSKKEKSSLRKVFKLTVALGIFIGTPLGVARLNLKTILRLTASNFTLDKFENGSDAVDSDDSGGETNANKTLAGLGRTTLNLSFGNRSSPERQLGNTLSELELLDTFRIVSYKSDIDSEISFSDWLVNEKLKKGYTKNNIWFYH